AAGHRRLIGLVAGLLVARLLIGLLVLLVRRLLVLVRIAGRVVIRWVRHDRSVPSGYHVRPLTAYDAAPVPYSVNYRSVISEAPMARLARTPGLTDVQQD